MGMNKFDKSDRWLNRDSFIGMDDFENYATGGLWTSVVEGSATIAVADGDCGIVTMSGIDSTNNRELYLKHTAQMFTFQANKGFSIESYVQFTEGNTSAINFAFGVANGVTNDMLVDDGGGLKVSGSFACIYKVDGTNYWKTGSSVGTTQNLSTSTKTSTSTGYQVLRIDVMPVSSTIAEITYFVNDQQLLQSGGRPGQNFIKDQLTYTGAAAMQMFFGLKQGSTTAESINIDYAAWAKKRGPLYS